MSEIVEMCRVIIEKNGKTVFIQRKPLDEENCDYLEIMLPHCGTISTKYLLTSFQVNVTNLECESEYKVVITSRRASGRAYSVAVELDNEVVILSESYGFPYNRSSFKRTVGGMIIEVLEG